MDKVAIIMPAYNEERRIGATLKEYSAFFKSAVKNKIFDYNIIVVINNTTDRTEEIVREIIKRDKKISYIDLLHGGKGYAVIEGFKLALKRDFDYIGFVDADMATPPEELFKVIKATKGYDGAIADRYLKNSQIFPSPSMKRLIARRSFNFLIRTLLLVPFGDTQCGAKFFKKKVLGDVINKLSMSQWAFDVELLYHLHKNGYKLKRVPTKWCDKEYSKINFWRAGPWMTLGVIRLRLLNSNLRSFVRIYDKLIRFIPK